MLLIFVMNFFFNRYGDFYLIYIFIDMYGYSFVLINRKIKIYYLIK